MKTRSFLLAALAAALSPSPSFAQPPPIAAHVRVRYAPGPVVQAVEDAGARVALVTRRGMFRRTSDLLVVGPLPRILSVKKALGDAFEGIRRVDGVEVTVAYSTGPRPPEKWWDFSPPHPFDPGIGMQRYSRTIRETWDPARMAAELPALQADPVAFTVDRIRTETWGGHIGGYLAHLEWSIRLPETERPLARAEVDGAHHYGP
jgi:hypothetical protein